jgi:hypothetical protein
VSIIYDISNVVGGLTITWPVVEAKYLYFCSIYAFDCNLIQMLQQSCLEYDNHGEERPGTDSWTWDVDEGHAHVASS